MSRKKKLLTAASTFSVALGIGFVMQYGDAVASRLQPADQETAITPTELVAPQQASVVVALPVPKATQTLDIPVPVVLAALDTGNQTSGLSIEDAPTLIPEPVCDITMDALALPLAMVAVSIAAPCHPNAAVTIHHQGMMFTVVSDQAGQTEVLVPALAQEAFFISAFANGEGAVADVAVPELANVDRAALQWQGVNAVQLHALEFGADYDSEGHVWSAAARELDLVNLPQDGFLVTLGDPSLDTPLMAEVYTFPSGTTSLDGSIALTVEAEVTAENCGRDIAAQSIQIDPLSEPTAIDLTMTMPECSAVGEFLVLNNMFKDLKLAAK